MVTKSPHGEEALSLLIGGLIGYVASLLDEHGGSSAAQRSLDAQGTLTSTQYAEAVTWLLQQRGGESHYQLATDHIRFICTKCPFGEAIKQAPGFCHLIGAGLWWGAVQHFGYGKVVFKQRIAVGDEQCDIRVYLKQTAAVDSEEGIADLSTHDPSPAPVGPDVSANETIRLLRARIRRLEHKVEELGNALEERKLIEKAKGILMERLKLTEAEAMRRLQKESQGQNKRLAEIAHIIVQAGKII
ncbi:ANTAR domain-containing response regulator [Candidatus Methylomirabilis sp.]|uniref:ANTAR domain-containing response regulator n=1 Tax=Candidatus Methylomirabilis sp. TaxID=2032687 RepID=UPI003C74FB4C